MKKCKNIIGSDASFLTLEGKGLQILEECEPQNKRRGLRNLTWLETGDRTHGHTVKRHCFALESINLLSKNEIIVGRSQFGWVQIWLMSTGSRDEWR